MTFYGMYVGWFLLVVCLWMFGIWWISFVLYCRPLDTPVKHFRAAKYRCSGGRPKEPWVLEEVLRLYLLIDSYGKACAEFNRLFAHLGVTVCKTTVHTWVQKYLTEMEVVRS